MSKTQLEIQLAERFLELNESQQALLLEVMELIMDNPARKEFALNWKGKAEDLPAALAQI